MWMAVVFALCILSTCSGADSSPPNTCVECLSNPLRTWCPYRSICSDPRTATPCWTGPGYNGYRELQDPSAGSCAADTFTYAFATCAPYTQVTSLSGVYLSIDPNSVMNSPYAANLRCLWRLSLVRHGQRGEAEAYVPLDSMYVSVLSLKGLGPGDFLRVYDVDETGSPTTLLFEASGDGSGESSRVFSFSVKKDAIVEFTSDDDSSTDGSSSGTGFTIFVGGEVDTRPRTMLLAFLGGGAVCCLLLSWMVSPINCFRIRHYVNRQNEHRQKERIDRDLSTSTCKFLYEGPPVTHGLVFPGKLGSAAAPIDSVGCNQSTKRVEAECSICLSEFQVGDCLRKLRCSHHFHAECIDKWLLERSVCPCCRLGFKEPETDRSGNPLPNTTQLPAHFWWRSRLPRSISRLPARFYPPRSTGGPGMGMASRRQSSGAVVSGANQV